MNHISWTSRNGGLKLTFEQKILKETDSFVIKISIWWTYVHSFDKKGCHYYSFTKHRLGINRSVEQENSKEFSAIHEVSPWKPRKVFAGWQWANNGKQLEIDKLSPTSARNVLEQRPSTCKPVPKQIGKGIETNPGLIPVDLKVDETGLPRNIVLSEMERARHKIESKYASLTVHIISENAYVIQSKEDQTIAFKNIFWAIEILRHSMSEKN